MPEEKKDAYQLFDAFLESFIEKKSFITKDEGVYNADLFKELKRIYIEKGLSTPDYHIEKTKYPDFEEDGSVGLFFNKAMLQVGHISNKEYRHKLRIVFSDMLWLHYLPIFEMSDVNKNMRISQWLNNGNLYDHIFPEKGLASYSFAKQMIDQDLQFLINLFSDLLNEMVSDKIDVETLKSKIKEFSINTKRYPPIRNMLLNLCFQKEYEPISTTSTKEKIARNLYPFFFKIEWDDKNVNVDVALQNIVNEININNFTKYGEHFMEKGERFFAKEIEKLWKNEYVANTYEILTKYQKQVILYGAPGTSKTYNAERAIEEFLDNSDFDKTRLFNNNKLDLGKIKFSEYEKNKMIMIFKVSSFLI